MTTNHGYVKFKYNGVELKGVVLQVIESNANLKIQEWQLMLHPDTDTDLLKTLF
jgi:hypothetical protein